MNTKKLLLRLGAAMSFALVALHIGVIFVGAPAYRFFDAGEEMATMAEQGSLVPALTTLVVVIGLAGFGVYALAGAGDVPRLPFQPLILKGIAVIYLLRGLPIVVELFLVFASGYALKSLMFSVVALAIGVIHAFAVWQRPAQNVARTP